MSKRGSPAFGVLLADGMNLLSAKPQSFPHKNESITEPTHGLGDSSEEHTPVGMRRFSLSQDGAFFDNVTSGMHAAMKASTGVSRVLCFAPDGNVIGQRFVGCQGVSVVGYEVLVQNGKLTRANASYQVTGQVDEGVVLQHHTAKTADWNTKTDGASVDYAADPSQRVVTIGGISIANPTVITTNYLHGLATGDIILISGSNSTPTIDGSRTVTVVNATTFTIPVNVTGIGTAGTFVRANSPNGGVGYLQVSDASGFTNFVGKIRDSPDDTTYADLITFADNVADPFAERATVAGVVDRYLSFDGNVTGTGSITPFVGFSRNAPA